LAPYRQHLRRLRSVPRTQVEVGRNLGADRPQPGKPGDAAGSVAGDYVRTARGLGPGPGKLQWAAEMVFGCFRQRRGGLGWFLYKQRYFLEVPKVFAGMLVIISIGLMIENILFSFLERHTVARWGMSIK